MKKLYVLMSALLFGCADSDRYSTSKYCCPDLIPVYKVGDTLEFLSGIDSVKKFKVVSIKEMVYFINNQRKISHRTEFERTNDNRKFEYILENALEFQDGSLFLYWEGCPSSTEIRAWRGYYNNRIVNGKEYAQCVDFDRFCGDTANPIRVIYDIKEGIVSYTDSSGTRWDLVPK